MSSPRGATRGIWNRKIGPCAAAARLGTIAVGQERCELVISHVAAEPSRDCVDLVESPAAIESARRVAAAASEVEA